VTPEAIAEMVADRFGLAGAAYDRDGEPFPASPIAPVSERAAQAFRAIGIWDD
jgi:hypothetical protein